MIIGDDNIIDIDEDGNEQISLLQSKRWVIGIILSLSLNYFYFKNKIYWRAGWGDPFP